MTEHRFAPVEFNTAGLITISADDENPFVLVPLTWVNEVNAFMYAARAEEMRPDHPGLLQAKADDNKANAATRFPELHECANKNPSHNCSGWLDAEGHEVIFTPHGYRRRADIESELGNDASIL